MLVLDKRIQPNHDEVAAKVIDGEAIVMNLNNGIYYSMDAVGSFVWEQVEKGLTADEVVQATCAQYDVSEDVARKDVGRLLGELLEENVIRLTDEPADGTREETGTATERSAYAAPTLHTYRDMGDLLALDPPAPGLEDIAWKE